MMFHVQLSRAAEPRGVPVASLLSGLPRQSFLVFQRDVYIYIASHGMHSLFPFIVHVERYALGSPVKLEENSVPIGVTLEPVNTVYPFQYRLIGINCAR